MVAVVVVAFDGGFFDGSVPAFDLSVGPGMVGLGKAMVGALRPAGVVDGHEEIELAFAGAHFGQIEVEVADGIAVELLPSGFCALHLRQTADTMPFQTTMKGITGQLRDRGFERIETVVERQQRVLAKGDDDGFLLHRQNRRP